MLCEANPGFRDIILPRQGAVNNPTVVCIEGEADAIPTEGLHRMVLKCTGVGEDTGRGAHLGGGGISLLGISIFSSHGPECLGETTVLLTPSKWPNHL